MTKRKQEAAVAVEEIPVYCAYTDMVRPSTLQSHPRNDNTHPESQIAMLAKSVRECGWRHPIVVSKRSGFIVAGHGRKLAALLMDVSVPVDYQDFASDTEEIAFLMADNIIPELAVKDLEKFEMNKSILMEARFDIEAIGIPVINVKETDLGMLIRDSAGKQLSELCPEDHVADPSIRFECF